VVEGTREFEAQGTSHAGHTTRASVQSQEPTPSFWRVQSQEPTPSFWR
jgi:hypothetical protein